MSNFIYLTTTMSLSGGDMDVGVKIGDVVDGYKIIGLIHKGGMGVIYKARDLKRKRFAALKFTYLDFGADARVFDSYKKEEEYGRRISHKNIIKIYMDVPSKSKIYIAMEYVEGRDLRDILRKKRIINEKRAINIAVQVCDALQYLHKKGIVHLDLKPENIIISKRGLVKIIDFGLAEYINKKERALKSLPSGTPAYISPEQAIGYSGGIRSDIYSLGIIIYEMLTGRLPFKGGLHSPLAMKRHIYCDPMPLRIYNPKLSANLQLVISKAIKRHPSERYANVSEMKMALLRSVKVKSKEGALEEAIPSFVSSLFKGICFRLSYYPQ